MNAGPNGVTGSAKSMYIKPPAVEADKAKKQSVYQGDITKRTFTNKDATSVLQVEGMTPYIFSPEMTNAFVVKASVMMDDAPKDYRGASQANPGEHPFEMSFDINGKIRPFDLFDPKRQLLDVNLLYGAGMNFFKTSDLKDNYSLIANAGDSAAADSGRTPLNELKTSIGFSISYPNWIQTGYVNESVFYSLQAVDKSAGSQDYAIGETNNRWFVGGDWGSPLSIYAIWTNHGTNTEIDTTYALMYRNMLDNNTPLAVTFAVNFQKETYGVALDADWVKIQYKIDAANKDYTYNVGFKFTGFNIND